MVSVLCVKELHDGYLVENTALMCGTDGLGVMLPQIHPCKIGLFGT